MKLNIKVILVVFPFLIMSCKKENIDVSSSTKFEAEIYSILSYNKADAEALLTIDDCGDTFYWCSSNEQKLIKLEVLGQGDDISIIFKRNGIDKPYNIVEHYILENSYTIVPLKSNEYLQGGEIIVSNHGKLLRKLTISYDGCD